MSEPLDASRIAGFLDALARETDGEWLVIGGAIVAAWLDPRRTTVDIDVMGLAGTPQERLTLLDLAERQGLGIETVNSAADWFVRRIPDWREQVEVHVEDRSTVYRPTPTLLALLKIGRLSEADLGDCRVLIASHGDRIDRPRVLTALDALPPTGDTALAARRAELRAALTSA